MRLYKTKLGIGWSLLMGVAEIASGLIVLATLGQYRVDLVITVVRRATLARFSKH